jgi:hypothetical protein
MLEQIADYPAFREEWIAEIGQGEPSNVEKGRRFAAKLFVEWLDLAEDDETIFCDGSGDGGIDLAVLERGESDETGSVGDTWYLVQSKYGSAWAGPDTALQEGLKIISTLNGDRKLSSLSAAVCDKLTTFRQQAGENDRIVLTFATIDPPSNEERKVLDQIRDFGRMKFGPIFDVETVSLRTIYDRLVDELNKESANRLTVPIKGALARGASDLLVGVAPLSDLYQFLKAYRSATQNLDQLYERNVRRFLGGRVKVNKAMQETLRYEPERFGLFNNGITVVVSDFAEAGDGQYNLTEPFVVNGCQTTRSIWEVLDAKLGAGGTGENEDPWRKRAETGVVVVKIAKVGSAGDELLNQITRYTNSQNVVREKDFIALDNNFRSWQRRLETERDLYLEIQRGGWDSRRALQKQRPEMKQLKDAANAQELLKVYGAGWLSEPGMAFGKNPPFLPGGTIFERIMSRSGSFFDVGDLYAAHLLQRAGEEARFGRGAKKISRRQTKYLFAFVAVSLLRDSLQKAGKPHDEASISAALIQVLSNSDSKEALVSSTGDVVDGYLQEGAEDAVFAEEVYRERFGFDLNRFLKWEQLGRDLSKTPGLKTLVYFQQQFMGRSMGGVPSKRETLLSAICT